jgi:hypothetical protein
MNWAPTKGVLCNAAVWDLRKMSALNYLYKAVPQEYKFTKDQVLN